MAMPENISVLTADEPPPQRKEMIDALRFHIRDKYGVSIEIFERDTLCGYGGKELLIKMKGDMGEEKVLRMAIPPSAIYDNEAYGKAVLKAVEIEVAKHSAELAKRKVKELEWKMAKIEHIQEEMNELQERRMS